MTYLEILGWARKGINYEQERYRSMQSELATKGRSRTALFDKTQEEIDRLDVLRCHLDEIQELHDKKL